MLELPRLPDARRELDPQGRVLGFGLLSGNEEGQETQAECEVFQIPSSRLGSEPTGRHYGGSSAGTLSVGGEAIKTAGFRVLASVVRDALLAGGCGVFRHLRSAPAGMRFIVSSVPWCSVATPSGLLARGVHALHRQGRDRHGPGSAALAAPIEHARHAQMRQGDTW